MLISEPVKFLIDSMIERFSIFSILLWTDSKCSMNTVLERKETKLSLHYKYGFKRVPFTVEYLYAVSGEIDHF